MKVKKYNKYMKYLKINKKYTPNVKVKIIDISIKVFI